MFTIMQKETDIADILYFIFVQWNTSQSTAIAD